MVESSEEEVRDYLNEQLDGGMPAAELREYIKHSDIEECLLDEVLDKRIEARYAEKEKNIPKAKRPILLTLVTVYSIFFILGYLLLFFLGVSSVAATGDMDLATAVFIFSLIIIGPWIVVWALLAYCSFFMKKVVLKPTLWLILLILVLRFSLLDLILVFIPWGVLYFYSSMLD